MKHDACYNPVKKEDIDLVCYLESSFCEARIVVMGFDVLMGFVSVTLNFPAPAECRDDQYQCRNGQCISKDDRCNRRYDCADGSDEQECRKLHVSCCYECWDEYLAFDLNESTPGDIQLILTVFEIHLKRNSVLNLIINFFWKSRKISWKSVWLKHCQFVIGNWQMGIFEHWI